MKIRKNYSKVLCSVLFCFALGVTGCKGNENPSTSGDSTDSSTTSVNSDEFVVKFESKGGTAIPDQVIKVNNKVTKPTDPTQLGQIFLGWYWDEAGATPFDFESVSITSDTTIYASWEIDTDYFHNGPSGGGGGDEPAGDYTYTCASFPNWIVTDGCVVFAKGTSASTGTHFYKLTFSGVNSASFTTSTALSKFILFRCHKDTVTPVEAPSPNPGDAAGKIYNCTAETACPPGTYSFSFPEAGWYNYNY